MARLDLRDQGRSPWPTEGYDLGDLVADVADVAGALRDRAGCAAHVVGWGLGGAVALDLALSRPDLVAHLTLVGTSGWVTDPGLPGPDEPTAVALVWRARGGTAPDVLSRALGREHRSLCGPDERPSAVDALAEAARWVGWGFNPHDRQRAAWLGASGGWDDLAVLERLRPTVVHGVDDPLVPVAHGRRLARAVGGRLHEVSGAGHELTPRLVAAVLDAVAAG